MIITARRILKPENYLLGINNGERFYVASRPITQVNLNRVLHSGFDTPINTGQQVLPSRNGKVSTFNSDGGYKVLRDLPKENASRDVDIKDWHGNWHTVTIVYQRYPREEIPAPLVELDIAENLGGENIVLSPRLINVPTNYIRIRHIINLFLELYGECEVLQENLLPALNVPITRLNWDLLPPGDYPWAVLQPRIQGVINGVRGEGVRRVIQRRFEFLASHNPNFVATGRAGFRGYFVFGFPDKPFFVLESIFEGNATYVLGQDWNIIAQLSKGEILNGQLHLNRFVHNATWEPNLNGILI